MISLLCQRIIDMKFLQNHSLRRCSILQSRRIPRGAPRLFSVSLLYPLSFFISFLFFFFTILS